MKENGDLVEPFQLTAEDIANLKKTDDEYTLMTWEYVKEVIALDKLEKLTRTPSQLNAYRAWSSEIQSEYGGVTNFLLQRRLYWKPVLSPDSCSPPEFEYKSPIPFAERDDYRILINDWPYGLEPNLRHICVWLKTPLPVDNQLGALTAEGFEMVEKFVRETFDRPLGVEGDDKVVWFKNPTSIQSIRSVHHVHVLIRDVEFEAIQKIVEIPPFE